MTRTFLFTILLLLLTLLGCSPEKNPIHAKNLLPSPVSAGPEAELVDVDGHKLMRAEAEVEAEIRIKGNLARKGQHVEDLSTDQLDKLWERTLAEVTDQFIMKTLLEAEAERRGIVVSDNDKQRIEERIRSQLPPGMTIEQAMKESPMGAGRMRREMEIATKIDALLAIVMKEHAAVSDAEIDAFYGANKDRLLLPERVRARHIQIHVPVDAPDATRNAKKNHTEGIRSQLLQGADFAELARRYSDSPSRQLGGDLGFFGKGKIQSELETAAFSQQPNEVGPVIVTASGYHILQVIERRASEPVPREQVAEFLAKPRRDNALQSLVQDLKRKANIQYGTEASAPRPKSMQPTKKATP